MTMTSSSQLEAFGEFFAPIYLGKYQHNYRSGDGLAIDDRSANDKSHLFCDIAVKPLATTPLELILTLRKIPYDEEVEDVVDDLEGNWTTTGLDRAVSIVITIKSAPDIRKLARAIRKVVGRGKRYTSSHWKWVAPRTADSLEIFARHLAEFRRNVP